MSDIAKIIQEPRGLTPDEVTRLLSGSAGPPEIHAQDENVGGQGAFSGGIHATTHPGEASDSGRLFALIDLAAAVILYGLSTIFSVRLFVGFAGSGLFDQITMGLLGGAFDLSKIGLWVSGRRERNAIYIALALGFTAISLLASTANAFKNFEASEAVATTGSYEVGRLKKEIAELDAEIEIENARLSGGSALYRTDARESRAARDALKERRDNREAALATLLAAPKGADSGRGKGLLPAALVSDRTNKVIEAWFLGVMSFLVEAGGLATTDALIRRRRKA